MFFLHIITVFFRRSETPPAHPCLRTALNIIIEGRPTNSKLTPVFVIGFFFFTTFSRIFSNRPISSNVVKLFPPEMAFFDSLSLPGSTVSCLFSVNRPHINSTKFSVLNGTEVVFSNETVKWTYKYYIFAVDGGSPKRGDRIAVNITFDASCETTGAIVPDAITGEVFFRAPGLTSSEYRKSLLYLFFCLLPSFVMPVLQYCNQGIGAVLLFRDF